MKQALNFILFLLLAIVHLKAQTFSGAFNGDINGTPATLTLQENGSQISGQINASGYIYTLNGTANGNNTNGKLTDTQTQGAMNFSGLLQGNNLTLSLSTVDGAKFELQFFWNGATTGGSQEQNNNNGTVSVANLDQRVVGNWLYSKSYTSGEFSFANQYRLIIKPDGTYLYGDGKVAGGGPGVGGISEGGGMSPGKWKTEKRVIHIDEGYGWQPYAKYYVEGNSMMLTFSDGSKQIWERYY